MSKSDPIVIFNNGEEDFEKLMEKLIYRKLNKNRIVNNQVNEIMCNKDTHDHHLPKDS